MILRHTDAGNISTLTNKQLREVIAGQSNQDICAISFWRHKFKINVQNYFGLAYEATKESRLRLLHFKLIHNIYPTNILLEKLGIRKNNKCLECQVPDYIERAFVYCPRIKTFWEQVKRFIFCQTNTQIELSAKTAVFGVCNQNIFHSGTRNKINHILLVARLSISKLKYGKIKNLAVIFDTELQLRDLL